MNITKGLPRPLGATPDAGGVNFALASASATAVDLCLFDGPWGDPEEVRLELPAHSEGVWHGHVAGIGPGQVYGFRVHGAWDPPRGWRFNPAKLLLDPYARAITGPVFWHRALVDAYQEGGIEHPSPVDSATVLPRSVVVDAGFDWNGDRPPRVPWEDSVVYECHVRGLTLLHPEVPPELRGTYLGLASEPVIHHLQSLGVTAVELLPVQHSASERHLVRRGLRNYWGYSTVGHFAPDARFAVSTGGGQVAEFQTMVRRLHAAGIEVILDVVYNHTGEGGTRGPTVSLRGLDNVAYYRVAPGDGRAYTDFSGCGNSLDLENPDCMRLVMDSLRYWVEVMHVDGFRFDLATALAREDGAFDPGAAFLRTVYQDPVLSGVKLIAEPWDLGPDGYQLGRFPRGWAEWNGQFRDTVRRFWRGDPGHLGHLASRITGSSDVFAGSGRGPTASVNLVTSHDGFTMRDLVSYEHKHNEANGEGNRDGESHNFSHNWGVEGPTDDSDIENLRVRMIKNLLSTLVLSLGVPMLRQGDEMGRTQGGNNNAYCQDNRTSWVDWNLDASARDLLDFTRGLLSVRREARVFRRSAFFAGDGPPGANCREITWLKPDGTEMSGGDWSRAEARRLGMLVRDAFECRPDEHGDCEEADARTLLLLVNGGRRATRFRLSPQHGESGWEVLVDTAGMGCKTVTTEEVAVAPHALLLLGTEGCT